MSGPLRNRALVGRDSVRGLIQVAISAILLALTLRVVNWGEVRDALFRINVQWLLLAWALFLLGLIVRAGRWKILLDALGVSRSWRELTLWYFVGGFFNVILPTGFGGDVIRVAELAQDTRRAGLVLNSVIVDRYLGLIVLLGMGLVAAVVTPQVAPPLVVLTIGVLFCGGLIAAWLLRKPSWEAYAERSGWWGWFVRRLRLPALAEAIAPYDRFTLLRGLAISLAFNILQIGWNMAIARGLELDLPPTVFLLLVPLTSAALLLPAFGGLGVREISYVGLFGNIGVPPATALALSLGVYSITVASGMVGGVLYLIQGIRRSRA